MDSGAIVSFVAIRHADRDRYCGESRHTKQYRFSRSKILQHRNFYQHDVSFGYEVDDNLRLRGGVTNLFDAEPSIQAGLQDQFDLFGRRYFLGLTYSY